MQDKTISVIIPVHKKSEQLNALRRLFSKEKNAELILVIQNNISFPENERNANEQFIYSVAHGRGTNLALALDKVNGEIIFINHADTMPPDNWYQLIVSAMADKSVAGGGFHLKFDKPLFFLQVLIFLSDILFYVTGEMWGDRSMFMRRDLIKDHKEIINVPIMEDVRLSHFLKKKGKVKMLKEKASTSSGTFMSRGILKHTFKILQCRFLYLAGKDPNTIYNAYYS